MIPWLPSNQPVPEQNKLMSWQRGIKHGYKLFLLLHSLPYTLVWCPHSIYPLNHGYYGVFHKYITLILDHWKFATETPSPTRGQTSSDLRLRSYIWRIHLLAMVYTLHIIYVYICIYNYKELCIGGSKAKKVLYCSHRVAAWIGYSWLLPDIIRYFQYNFKIHELPGGKNVWK